MLVLATKWGFTDLQKYAMQEIPKHYMEPIQKIALARQTHVTTWAWLRDPYVALCVRLAPVDYKEGLTLGEKTVAAINLARSRILQRRLELIRGDRPPRWMGTNFWHSNCWKSMAAMWREVVDQSASSYRYGDAAGGMKLILAKKKAVIVGARLADPLCKSCDNKALIMKWLKLSKDDAIAEKVLKENLDQEVEGL